MVLSLPYLNIHVICIDITRPLVNGVFRLTLFIRSCHELLFIACSDLLDASLQPSMNDQHCNTQEGMIESHLITLKYVCINDTTRLMLISLKYRVSLFLTIQVDKSSYHHQISCEMACFGTMYFGVCDLMHDKLQPQIEMKNVESYKNANNSVWNYTNSLPGPKPEYLSLWSNGMQLWTDQVRQYL